MSQQASLPELPEEFKGMTLKELSEIVAGSQQIEDEAEQPASGHVAAPADIERIETFIAAVSRIYGESASQCDGELPQSLAEGITEAHEAIERINHVRRTLGKEDLQVADMSAPAAVKKTASTRSKTSTPAAKAPRASCVCPLASFFNFFKFF